MYDAAVDSCGFSSERKKQEGYWFWQKFIEEVISNHVSYTIRYSGDNYYPEQLERKQFWIMDEDTLEKLGSCIGNLMVEKTKDMAREYEE